MFFILDQITEREGLDGGNYSIAAWGCHHVSLLGKFGCALQGDLDTSLACKFLGSFVLNHTSLDLLLALGWSHVLNAHVNALLQNSSIDQLVDANSNGCLGHVEYDTGASMVSLVRHTLVDRRVSVNINVVAHLDIHEILREMDRSMLPVMLGEHVARTRSDTE
jgi:hypothetical protein